MFLVVPSYPGCPGQSPESRKMVVCVYMFVCCSYAKHGNNIYVSCILLQDGRSMLA